MVAPESMSERYARQVALPFVGEEGQDCICRASVLIVGCGALGGMQAQLLARAGVGRLLLADGDVVERVNLHRQVLFTDADAEAGRLKAVAAADYLSKVNGQVEVVPLPVRVDAANVAEYAGQVDLVLDGTDNYPTRYLLNDYCVSEGRPFIHGGILAGGGQVLPVFPGQGPCLRCVFPDMPHNQPTGEEAGIWNAAVAWVAALQVSEAMKAVLSGLPERFFLHALDMWEPRLRSLPVTRQPGCPCCEKRDFTFLSKRETL